MNRGVELHPVLRGLTVEENNGDIPGTTGADGLTVGQDGGLRRGARAHFAGGNAAKEKPSSRSTARLLAGRGSRWHHSRHYSKNWVIGKRES